MSNGKEDPCYKLKVEEIELMKKKIRLIKERTMILLKTGNKDEAADAYVNYMTELYRLSAEVDVLKLRAAVEDDDVNEEANAVGQKISTNSMMALFNLKMDDMGVKKLVNQDKIKENPKEAFTEMMGNFGELFGDIFATAEVRPTKKDEKNKTKKIELVKNNEEEELSDREIKKKEKSRSNIKEAERATSKTQKYNNKNEKK